MSVPKPDARESGLLTKPWHYPKTGFLVQVSYSSANNNFAIFQPFCHLLPLFLAFIVQVRLRVNYGTFIQDVIHCNNVVFKIILNNDFVMCFNVIKEQPFH